MSVYTRPVFLLLCGLLLLTISMAVLNTLVPLWLNHQQLATWQVGMVSSAYFTGNLLGTLLAGGLIRRYGFNRSYYFACVLFAVASSGLGIMVNFWSWLGWRFFAGIGCALIWVIVESAMMRSGTACKRGQLLAAYMVVYYCGTVIGQMLLGVVSTQLLKVLPWVVALVVLAVLPMLLARFPCQNDDPVSGRVWPMLLRRPARLGIIGCIISGIILGSLYGLMPLYLSHQGTSDANVGWWMAFLVSAGILGQWPMGRMADRYGRQRTLRIQVLIMVLASLAMLSGTAMAPFLFILGFAGFTLYPVAMSWACEEVESHELVAMNQALLLSYTIGSLMGPGMTAVMMEHYSDHLLFVMSAMVALCYLVMLRKRADGQTTPWVTDVR